MLKELKGYMDIIKKESLPEMKYSLVWLNTRRQISELKDTARETIQTEAQRRNVKKKQTEHWYPTEQ